MGRENQRGRRKVAPKRTRTETNSYMLFYNDGRHKDAPCEEPFDNHKIVLNNSDMKLTDKLIIEYFKDMLVNFNSSLRGGETPRIFKGVKRLVKYTYKNGNTSEKYVWIKPKWYNK